MKLNKSKYPLENLENLIVDNKHNKKNLSKLISEIGGNKLISFLGAGTSKPLGIPDWSQLLKELLNCCDEDFKSTRSDLLKEKNSEKWPVLADEIYNELVKMGKEEIYFSILKSRMKPKINSTTISLVKLILSINVHLTTNFDVSLEEAYNFYNLMSNIFKNESLEKKLIVKYIPDIEEYPTSSDPHIYYLHGNHIEEKYIFRKTEYDTYYPTISNTKTPNYCIEACLRYFFKNYSILFIGFSFYDKYVRDFLFHISKQIQSENKTNDKMLYFPTGKEYNPNTISHFMLIDTSNDFWKDYKHNIFEYFENYNILPVVYEEGKHYFVEKLFETLSENKIDEK